MKKMLFMLLACTALNAVSAVAAVKTVKVGTLVLTIDENTIVRTVSQQRRLDAVVIDFTRTVPPSDTVPLRNPRKK